MFCRDCGGVSEEALCAACTEALLERARVVEVARHGPRLLMDRDVEEAIAAFEGQPVKH